MSTLSSSPDCDSGDLQPLRLLGRRPANDRQRDPRRRYDCRHQLCAVTPASLGLGDGGNDLSALVNALPFSYDNILLGFNTHFYLLLAFSFASLWFMADSRAWSPRWAAGALFGLASFLCMASGALTLAAAIGLHLLQMACGRRGGMREWFGIAAVALATAVLASLIPHAPSSDIYRAHSLRQFLAAVFELASWPALPIWACSWRRLRCCSACAHSPIARLSAMRVGSTSRRSDGF